MSRVWRPLATLLLGGVPAGAQAPSPNLVAGAARNVGQVIASDCTNSGPRTGTAFVWPDPARVVTARHVVAGCRTVRVQFPGGPSVTATPERELPQQDLLLLRLAAPSGRTPVAIGAALPPIHSRVAAVGYSVGAPTPDDKLLTVTVANREPGAQLRDMLPSHISAEIQRTGPWRLDTGILRLDGNLVSGLSGAPLFAADGRVVAIGAGGLADGSGGIVWAVRAMYLPRLQAAPAIAAVAALARPTRLAFADQAPRARRETVRCGRFDLTLSRTVPLSTLAASTDDPSGLQQLLATVSGAAQDLQAARYDVWVDLESGAAIPVPAGARLTSGPIGCVAIVSPGIGLNIVTHRATSSNPAQAAADIQMFSQAFENSFVVPFPGGLQIDPAFTYRTPVVRPDGFIANRKAAGSNRMVGPNQLQAGYVFMTHMTRGGSYAGVSAIRQVVMPADEAQACMMSNAQACQVIAPYLRDWAKAAVAVHMATIPPI